MLLSRGNNSYYQIIFSNIIAIIKVFKIARAIKNRLAIRLTRIQTSIKSYLLCKLSMDANTFNSGISPKDINLGNKD